MTALSASDIDFINHALGDALPYTYFSLRFFIRGDDESLKAGDLTPGATTRVTASIPSTVYKQTYQSDHATSLRCMRRTKLL